MKTLVFFLLLASSAFAGDSFEELYNRQVDKDGKVRTITEQSSDSVKIVKMPTQKEVAKMQAKFQKNAPKGPFEAQYNYWTDIYKRYPEYFVCRKCYRQPDGTMICPVPK